jgi:hypothetical protein
VARAEGVAAGNLTAGRTVAADCIVVAARTVAVAGNRAPAQIPR